MQVSLDLWPGETTKTMKDTSMQTVIPARYTIVRTVVFCLSMSVLVFVPLAFSTPVYRTFSLPKFLILLTASVALVPLLVLIAASAVREVGRRGLKHLLLVFAYVAMLAISTAFGVAPAASLFGSFENQMGLITRICFYLCFLGIISGIGQSWKRLMQSLWAMSLTGLCVATYAFAQFFGRDFFLPPALYTFNSMGETVVRPIGTLGHADYLGNFLLYTTPVCAGLALAARGRTRRFAIITAAVSTAAIAFSGTRGAWLGLIVGGVVFIALELPGKSEEAQAGWLRRLSLTGAIGCFVILLSVLLIASNPASRNIFLRARLLVTEGFTGAGRTLLWRDSLRMAPDYPIAGCGPEGFRKSFLAYKSGELARYAPDINNESSHNSYLDSAISYGLPGAALYAAIIASVFSLLSRARRRTNKGRRAIISGVLSSFAAVAAHNVFIFDQIPTGLYFFGFLALAYVVANMTDPEQESVVERDDPNPPEAPREKVPSRQIAGNDNKRALWAIAISGVLLLVSASYSFLEMNADTQLSKAFVAANQGDLDQVISHVNSATGLLDPTGARAFVAARALTLCAERVQALRESNRRLDDNLARSKATAIGAAMQYASRSLARTLTPDSNHLLLAYLAYLSGDIAGLRAYAAEAVKWDPRFANTRWLRAEAYLAEGDLEQAAHEAELALNINPSLRQARIILARARGESEPGRPTSEEALERARGFISAGKQAKAEKILRRAIAGSRTPCPECHRLLASIYETADLYENAIAEWQTFMNQAPDRASIQEAASRIDSLKQKKGTEK